MESVHHSGTADVVGTPHGSADRQPFLGDTQLRALQERFVVDPAGTDLSVLRPVIARSWNRSLRWAVSPELRRFDQYREPRVDDQLLQCAAPVLDELERMSADTGVSIYLADQDGTIAAVRASAYDAGMVRELAEPGTAMSEDVTGTNSDGTALEEGRAVQVWGAEHFCEGMRHLCCTSVPVLDPLRRSVRAVLSLSLPERVARAADARSMALIAQGAAAEITQLLTARLAVREQALLSSYLAEVRKRGADSVVVMDDHTTIASKGALHMLGQSDYAVLAGYARESERTAAPVQREMTLEPGTTLRVQASPITSDGETIGSVIRLRPPKSRRNRLTRAATPRRTDPFTSMVGESLALRRALEVAATAVRRRAPAYILGEPGTGKTHLAELMAAEVGADAHIVDCAGSAATKPADLARLRKHLQTGSPLVLDNVDEVATHTRAQLSELLMDFDHPPVIMTMTTVRNETSTLMSALGGVEVELPPLRNRRDDIPLLVNHLLARGPHGVLQVTPQLLRALIQTDWTHNVAQLKEFVDTAAARCSFGELGIQHLSEAHRRIIARNPLSRLEEAELHQIQDALADAKGNRVRAAELLQIGRSTLYRKIESYSRRGYILES